MMFYLKDYCTPECHQIMLTVWEPCCQSGSMTITPPKYGDGDQSIE